MRSALFSAVFLWLVACEAGSPPDEDPCLDPETCELDPPSEVPLLGADYHPEETRFAIWSPDHAEVFVSLEGVRYPMAPLPESALGPDVFQVVVPGDHRLAAYHFELDGRQVRDPYAKMVEPNTDESIVMDMSRTELADGWSPRPPLLQREDAIIYELHVRDFTIASDSGISEQLRGSFLGMVEGGTSHAGLATGIDHLKELGITHVQLMPVYDFASCADLADTSCYNWGYDPRNFSVPEERYSLTPLDYENRAREFKRMVDAFHRAGIRVVMDVVYNHTHSKSMFENISASYYTASDLSGTGNSLDASVPMVSRMIEDSLAYWVKEYNIDGFRFDLAGVFDYEDFGAWGRRLNEQFPERTLLLYGEPWNGYAGDPREASRVRLGTIGRIQDAHVGVFNPKYRDALKGRNDSGGCDPGDCYVFNQSPDTARIVAGSRAGLRAIDDPLATIDLWDQRFAMDPEQSINYVSAHDNLCLRDKILRWAATAGVAADSAYLRRIQMFANGIVLTSQGIAFLHGGVEMMRDKKGDKNSYASGDEVNQISWSWKLDNADVLAYYEDVIAIRKQHPAFRMSSWQQVKSNIQSDTPSPGLIVHRIDGAAVHDSWAEILLIYNSAGNTDYPLPAGEWKVAMEKSDPDAGNDRIVSAQLQIEGTAVTILHRE